MELLPSDVEARTFHVVRKGYDADEVQAYLKKVALQMSSLEERAKIALVKADRLERKLFDTQRSADPVAGAYDDALEIRRRVIAEAEAEAERIRQEATAGGAAFVDVAIQDDTAAMEGARQEALRLEDEARRLLEDVQARAERAETEAAAVLADARARAERIVASAVATADRTRDERSHGSTITTDGSRLFEPERHQTPASMTVDLTGETPRIEVAPSDPVPVDTKPSRYMSRSAGLPRIGDGAGSVLQDMAKVRRRDED